MTLPSYNFFFVPATENKTISLDCTSTLADCGPTAVEILPLEHKLEIVLGNKELLVLEDSTSL